MSLKNIIETTKESIKNNISKRPLKDIRRAAEENKGIGRRDFLEAVAQKEGRKNIIAEFKRASPSKGRIIDAPLPDEICRTYESAGAAAISILTERRFFSGSMDDLKRARECTGLPVLRKDFIISEYQIYESAAYNSDSILLIVKILGRGQLQDFFQMIKEYNITPLLEVHSEKELEEAMRLEPDIIGINNRDLETLQTDIATTKKMMPLIPEGILILSESGISDPSEIRELSVLGVSAFLVGEALLTAKEPGERLKELVGA